MVCVIKEWSIMQRLFFVLTISFFCLLSMVPSAAQSCSVSYSITNSWTGGFQAGINITNTSATVINSWTLQWSFNGNEQISNGWNGTFGQNRQTVTVTNASYNNVIPAGGSVSGIGFTANSSATSAVPGSFTVNGVQCAGGVLPAPTALSAVATTILSAVLSWTASPASGITYNIYRSTTAGFAPSPSTRIASSVAATSFADNTLAASTTYFYLVTAANSISESSPSNQASAATLLRITSVTPSAGVPGSLVTITGSLFGGSQGQSVVDFGTAPAAVTSWSANSVVVAVPNLAVATVNLSVIVNGASSNALAFSVTNTPPPPTLTGNATHFDALGSPYGGCGLPQSALDSQNFVALNVQNTPGDYTTSLSRPIPTQFAGKIGLFNNGLNCGRWVRVTMGDFCTGTNDGAPGKGFCYGTGGLIADQFNGAMLDMIVADSCQDGNGWCRDDPNHLDLATASINQFILNGQPVATLLPNHWNNRQISWQFIPAPNYTGDIKIAFIQGANIFWSAISITHLQNGIHGVDYFANGSWVAAKMNSDLGQSYIIAPTATNGSSYQIRVHDAADQLINNGRIYLFSFPASCGQQCGPPFNQVTYTVQ